MQQKRSYKALKVPKDVRPGTWVLIEDLNDLRPRKIWTRVIECDTFNLRVAGRINLLAWPQIYGRTNCKGAPRILPKKWRISKKKNLTTKENVQ